MKKIIAFTVFILSHLFIFSQTLTSISPSTANAGQTLNVTITGSNTNFTSGSTTVSFGFGQASTTINSFNVINATSIQANITVPPNTYTGNYNVYVYDNWDGNLSLSNGFYVNGVTPPTISSISPNTANAGQTLNVTITGANTHFNSGSATVSFGFGQGSSTVNSINVVNATSIQANITVPANTYTGNYDVYVYDVTDGTDGYLTLSNGMYISGLTPPTLSSISPNTANAGQTLNVTITGANTYFTSGSATVSFGFGQGSSTVNSVNVVNATSIQASITVPANTYTGYYDVYVYDNTDSYLTLSNGMYISGVTPPTISSISPNTANAGQTLNVTITGANTHFNSGSATVSFGFGQGSTTINSINVVNATSVQVNITVPSYTSSGDYYVNVYNSIDGNVSLNSGFHVNGITPPSLVSISPSTGNAGQTLNVTITGASTHFTSGSATVSFGFGQASTTINSINVVNDTSIQANITVPANIYAGNYNVYIHDFTDGNLTLSNGIYINGATAGTIASVSPIRAKAGQTLNVTITGTKTHFSSASGTIVGFNFNQASGTTNINYMTILNDSSIQANITVPSNISTGKYNVNVSNSIDGNLSSDFYVYTDCFSYFSTSYDNNTNTFTLTLDSLTSALGTSFNWDFGDGSTSSSQTPIHTFTADAIYNVCLTITTASGSTCSYCHNIGKDSNGNVIRSGGFSMKVVHYDGSVSVDSVLSGISEVKEKTLITIVPNPFSSQALLTLNKEVKNAIAKILDVTGKEVRTIIFSGTQVIIEKGELKSGLYFIQVVENNTVITRKIIIQ